VDQSRPPFEEMTARPSAAADFCNKIGKKVTSPERQQLARSGH
jgi:hypothetical protein